MMKAQETHRQTCAVQLHEQVLDATSHMAQDHLDQMVITLLVTEFTPL